MKKLFIKLSKLLGYEIIDQNKFVSPTLNKDLNEDLSSINDKSIILPLGEVKITKKVNSVLIIFRTNTEVEIWDQSKMYGQSIIVAHFPFQLSYRFHIRQGFYIANGSSYFGNDNVIFSR